MSCRVLIVDDSRLARMVMAKTLSTLRPAWERVEASNADEAIAAARRAPIDIALLDFNMPGRDGLALAAELKDLSPDVNLAVISANSQDEIVRRAHEVGATFLGKPVTERSLQAYLDSLAPLGDGTA